jgi:hypothetical protein
MCSHWHEKCIQVPAFHGTVQAVHGTNVYIVKIAYSAYMVTNVLQCVHCENCVVCFVKIAHSAYIVKIVFSVLCENCEVCTSWKLWTVCTLCKLCSRIVLTWWRCDDNVAQWILPILSKKNGRWSQLLVSARTARKISHHTYHWAGPACSGTHCIRDFTTRSSCKRKCAHQLNPTSRAGTARRGHGVHPQLYSIHKYIFPFMYNKIIPSSSTPPHSR